MKLETCANADAAARRAAEIIAADARAAIAARGNFVFAVSGGRTPWAMLRALATMDLPWDRLHLLQVDERVAPAGTAERNLTHIEASLREQAPATLHSILAMPVEAADLDAAASAYAASLRRIAGTPPMLDLVHLGLGADGHTASLVPDDPALGARGDVALAGPYQGHRRMTLTYPVLNRARRVLWLVTGAEKAPMLARFRAGDRAIPAGRVAREHALLLADIAAAGGQGRLR